MHGGVLALHGPLLGGGKGIAIAIGGGHLFIACCPDGFVWYLY